MRRESRLQALGLLITFGFLIPLIRLGLSTYPLGDDYGIYNSVHTAGYWSNMRFFYTHWSGRLLSYGIASLWYRFFNPFDSYYAVAVMAVLFFLLCVFLVENELSVRATSETKKPLLPTLVMSCAVFATFWWGLKVQLGIIVFWWVGGTGYLVPTLLGLLWIYLWPQALRTPNKRFIGVFALLSVAVGVSYEQLSVGLFAYLGIYLLLYRNDPRILKRGCLYAGCLLIGTIILLAAPGNFARAARVPKSFQLPVTKLPVFFAHLLVYYVLLGGGAFWILALLSGTVVGLLSPRVYSREDLQRAGCYVVFALATLLPMAAVPGFIEERSGWFFSIGMLMAILALSSVWASPWLRLTQKVSGQHVFRGICSVGMAVLYYLFVRSVNRDVFWARHLRAQIRQRDHYLHSLPPATQAAVPPFRGELPWRLHFDDVAEDSTYFVNQSQATYYGLKSIRLVIPSESKSL